MNQSQLKYARERAYNIKNEKLQALREERNPKVTLTRSQKLQALKDGRFSIKTSSKGPEYSWYDGVTFTDAIPGLSDKDYDARSKALEAAYTKLIDELVLGDNEKALELLKAFEAA